MKQTYSRIKKILVLLCLLCLFAGCNKQDTTSENNPQTGGTQENNDQQGNAEQGNGDQRGNVEQGNGGQQTDTAEDTVQWIASMESRTYGREGSFYSENNRIYFLDAATGEFSIICDDITCAHKKNECSAYFEGITYAALEEDHLVLATSHGGDVLWDIQLYEADVNGSNRKYLGTLGTMQSIYQMAFTEDKIIASYYNNIDENLEPIEENRAGISVYDRKTNTAEVVWEKQAFNAITSEFAYQDDMVYFIAFYFDVTMDEVLEYGERSNYLEERMRTELCSVNVKDKSFSVIQDNLDEAFLTICQDKVWFTYEEALWYYDIATGEKQKALDKDLWVVQTCGSDQLLLRDDYEYYTYTPEGNLVKIGTRDMVIPSAVFPEITYAFDYNTPTGNGEVIYWETEEFMSQGEVVPITKIPTATAVPEQSTAIPAPGDVETITWVIPNLVDAEDVEDEAKLVNEQLAKDGYNFALEIKSLPWLDYRQQVIPLIESGEADIISTGIDAGDGSTGFGQDMIRAGYFEELSGYLASEEGRRLKEWYCDVEWKISETDGGIYTIPNQVMMLDGGYLAFNKAYVTEEMLQDFSGMPGELEQLLSSIEIPKGVYGVLGEFSTAALVNLSGSQWRDGVFYNLKTGAVENPFENETFYKYMKEQNSLYTKGYIKQFNTPDWETLKTQAVEKRNFVVWLGLDYDMLYEEVKEDVITVPLKFAISGNASCFNGINKNSNRKEEALQLLTLLQTDETYANLLLFGKEGTNYQIVDGYVCAVDENNRLNIWSDMIFGIYDPALPKEGDDLLLNRRETKDYFYESEYYLDSVVLGFQPDFTVFGGDIPEALDVLNNALYSVWKEKDFDAAWQEAAKDYADAGGEQLVEEMDKQVKEWMATYR